MLRLIKLTEEEIAELPYPETARKIGGILDIVDTPLSDELLKKIRKQFRESLSNADEYRTPIIEDKEC